MKVLVTGADDVLGSAVLSALVDCGWAHPLADDRPVTPGLRERVQALALDARDTDALVRELPRVDAVVHCRGNRPGAIEAAAGALYGALARLPSPPLVVHMSSMTVYGSAQGCIDEERPLREDIGEYGAARVRAEVLARSHAGTIILRPGVEYGPTSTAWSLRVARWLRARRLGDLGAAGDGCANLVHVDDVAQAALLALRTPAAVGRAYNLVMDAAPTWNDYFIQFAIALGAVPVRRVTARRLKLETRALAIPLKLLELASARVPGLEGIFPPAIPPSLLGILAQDIRLCNQRAVQELGWRQRDLAAGLAQTARLIPT